MNYKRRGLRRRINQAQLVKILQQKFKDDFFARVSERLASEESPEIESISTFKIPPIGDAPGCEDLHGLANGWVFSHRYADLLAKLPNEKCVISPSDLLCELCTTNELLRLLNKAIEDELYERAALIRDELKRRSDD